MIRIDAEGLLELLLSLGQMAEFYQYHSPRLQCESSLLGSSCTHAPKHWAAVLMSPVRKDNRPNR